MGLLNLALGQFLALFLPFAAFLVALYFYDRSRRRVVVSTLRFWPRRPAPAVRRRHRRIQHPLSLLLQLAALLLLLLAIADPRPDGSAGGSRQVVMLLDTSAAMAAPGAGGSPLSDEARALALAYLDRVPAGDQVLLIEADGSPAVRVPFSTDRQRVREAILEAEVDWTALDLDAAFEAATGVLRLALDTPGAALADHPQESEVVYIGPGRFTGPPARTGVLPSVRFLRTSAPQDSLGLLALRALADAEEPGKWDVTVVAWNYGEERRSPRIDFFFDGRPLGHRNLSMPPGQEAQLAFVLRTSRPGRLLARIGEPDAFELNNEAAIELPTERPAQLQVHATAGDSFAPLAASGARVEVSFVDGDEATPDDAIHVFPRGGDPGQARRSVVFAPPGTPTPLEELASVRDLPIEQWSASHPLATGVRDRELAPSRARVFRVGERDHVVASTARGPVIVAREGPRERLVAFGFDPSDAEIRNRLATPLLFANAITWLDTRAFRTESVEARIPGSLDFDAGGSSAAEIDVRLASGEAVPWVLADDRVRFYSDERGTYRVRTADRDHTVFLSQPHLAFQAWEPADGVSMGLPSTASGAGDPWIPWPLLAALAGVILLYDWKRFGRGRPPSTASNRAVPSATEAAS